MLLQASCAATDGNGVGCSTCTVTYGCCQRCLHLCCATCTSDAQFVSPGVVSLSNRLHSKATGTGSLRQTVLITNNTDRKRCGVQVERPARRRRCHPGSAHTIADNRDATCIIDLKHTEPHKELDAHGSHRPDTYAYVDLPLTSNHPTHWTDEHTSA
jgi:hypothetical protein